MKTLRLGESLNVAFVRQPQGNRVIERAIRTLKEHLPVCDISKPWRRFAAQYNASWIRQRHGDKTPNQIGAAQKPSRPTLPGCLKWQHNPRKALSHDRAP